MSSERPVQAATCAYTSDEKPGAIIAGRYTLLERIGEGGMGEVWLARQTEPVKRKVALKLIKAGMDSKAILARFEQERQALAMMDHPNIARVLDGGLTESRRPFFVMELVSGLPLTKFCDDAKLTPQQRIELFVSICQAVQHAHQKGIVHRDLKPSNLLVTLVDGKPVPKVIDFGVAKATGGKLTDESLCTEFGAVVGTLEYMAPEQAGFSASDIDTRADIYSLGVILYELLTGLKPIDGKRLKQAALTEIVRIIREDEPSRPSTRLSTDKALPSVAALRQIEPKRLMAMLRGELDWVVMKCLEKERERRYATANALGRDLQRYLADEPVEARPPSARYRLAKVLHRHRGPVTAAGLLLLALLAGIAGTTFGLIRAEQARAAEAERARGERDAKLDAEAQKVKALEAAAAEKAANDQAQRRLAEVLKSNELLGSIFDSLDPKEIARAERPLQRILVDRLDQAVAQLEGEAIGDPLAVAAMQLKLGRSLSGLGEPAKAIVLLEKARTTFQTKLGPDDPSTLIAMSNLAASFEDAGRRKEALALGEETLTRQQATFGRDHPQTLIAMNNLAGSYHHEGNWKLAIAMHEEILRLQQTRLGRDHPDTMRSVYNLAAGHFAAGNLAEALPLYEEAYASTKAKLGPDHPVTLGFMNGLASACVAAHDLDRATPLFEELLRRSRGQLGIDHPTTLDTLSGLGGCHVAAGKFELGISLHEQVVNLRKSKLGADHPSTIQSSVALARAYQHAGKMDLAIPLLEQSLALSKASLGADHPDTLRSMNMLASAYRVAGRYTLAMPLFEETLRLMQAKFGPDHPSTLSCMHNCANCYLWAGKLDKGLALFERTVEGCRAKLGAENPSTLNAMNGLGMAYRRAGKLNEAVTLFEETLRLRKIKLGPDHPETLISMNNLATAYELTRKPDQAIALQEEVLHLRKGKLGADHPSTLLSMANLAWSYRRLGKLDQALPLAEKALERRRATLGPDHPSTLWSAYILGMVHQSAKRFDKAIPLLEEALKGREAKLGRNHPDTLDSVAGLGLTYKDAGRFADALPLLEEGYQASQKHSELRWIQRVWLVEASVGAGDSDKTAALAKAWVDDVRAKWPKSSPRLDGELGIVGGSLLRAGAFAEAEPLLRECLDFREKSAGKDQWNTFHMMSMLGGALMGQKRYAEAERLLLAAYEGMRTREKLMHPLSKTFYIEAQERLPRLYDAWNKPEEAARWREKLMSSKTP